MGIPNYFYHVLTNHNGIIQKLEYHSIHNLYLDANSIVYDCVHENEGIVNSYKDLYERVYLSILKVIKTINPQNKTFVSFDGVVPMAKMVQQKQRRYKSRLIKSILNKSNNSWNTNNITPGTEFMMGLDAYMIDKFKNNKKVVYSGSNEHGEGEHKICDYIKKHYSSSQNQNINHCIYGLDADLIMLGLLLTKIGHNIVLYRETKHFDYMPRINKNDNYIFLMKIMARQIQNIMHTSDVKTAINNYIVLCFLCGNDFLPHFASINIRNEGIHNIINVYHSLSNKNLVQENNHLHWKNINELFSRLCENETENIINNIQWKIDKSKQIRVRSFEDKLNALPLKDMDVEIYIMNNINKFNEIVFHNQSISKVCKNYLEMFEWTWWYYHGLLRNKYIYYEFDHAPLFSDLKLFTPIDINMQICPMIVNQKSIHSKAQLLYVLPCEEHSEHFSPDVLSSVYKVFPELRHSIFDINYSFCKFFWESHVSIPYLNFIEINELIHKTI
jgi:5'-3' exonuclease